MSIREELKEEYLFLQQTYEYFDNRALLIKGWCITISLGALALGFDSSKSGFSTSLFLFVGGSALLFWLIEAKWKTFQYANAYRIRIIEANFRGDEIIKILYHFKFIILGSKLILRIHPYINVKLQKLVKRLCLKLLVMQCSL